MRRRTHLFIAVLIVACVSGSAFAAAGGAEAAVRSASAMVALAILVVPVLYLLRGQSSDRQSLVPSDDPAYAFKLPSSLERVRVLRMDYRVEFDCGKVVEKGVSEERIVEPTSLPAPYRPDVPAGMSVRTVYHHQYSLLTADGRAMGLHSWFPAEVGQLVSVVNARSHVVLLYNHTTQEYFQRPEWLTAVHSFPGFPLYLACMGVAVAGFTMVQRVFVTDELAGMSLYRTWSQMLIFFTVPLAWFYVSAFKRFVQRARNRGFSRAWDPQYRALIESLDGPLKQALGRGPRGPKPRR